MAVVWPADTCKSSIIASSSSKGAIPAWAPCGRFSSLATPSRKSIFGHRLGIKCWRHMQGPRRRPGITTTFGLASATATSGLGESPLVGNMAPDFEAEGVLDQEFVKIKLSDYIGKNYVILFFYPLDFTFVCPTEITAFSDRFEEFQRLNTRIIGISTDSVFSHLAWVQIDRKFGGLGDLRYPLASDLTKSISRTYNVLIRDQGVALRGLFIIDKSGIIQYATINNLAFGRSVDETLRTLQAIQHVQQNPSQVCPAGWKPGDRSISADTKLSKDYFAAI